ncbi:transposase [Thalassotalea mangrovi]|uniref:Transposase n=1 Tax=Thalassotalea mangrovi TaxID=2572245 RepID=A0A4U1B9U8_9GAMM|nr:transposase [Thalassotalea mangrovi]TKB47567.1 transposase [Thalassotalea mangrovi]
MPTPRSKQICLEATPYYHCVSRCVRRAYLCGKDSEGVRCYEHRRGWIEERLLFLSQVFCIDVCAYAVMSNHCHVVLHVNEETAKAISDTEVIKSWHKLCRGTFVTQEFEQHGRVPDYLLPTFKSTVAVYRKRLMDISWFMRLLNEPIARMANAEDQCTGRFWEGRFTSQPLLDEAALIACMAYVDLNPIRAGIAEKPESSPYTSIKKRIGDLIQGKQTDGLMPFAGESKINDSKGLTFNLFEYVELVDLTGRAIRDNASGYIENRLPGILERIKISSSNWLILTSKFEHHFKGGVGKCTSLDLFCLYQKRKRRPNVLNCKTLFK